MDPVEVRRKNFIPKDAFPYTTALRRDVRLRRLRGGARPRATLGGLRRAARGAAPPPRGRRRRSSSASACRLHRDHEPARRGRSSARSRSRADGDAIVRTGSFSHGQGHETTFAMIVGERLGLPVERITRRQGRHGRDAAGAPGRSARSRRRSAASPRVARPRPSSRRAKALVGDYLEASAADIVARRRARSLPRRGDCGAVARVGRARRRARPPTIGSASSRSEQLHQAPPTFPFGVHIAVVEVDVDTGKVELEAPRRRRRRGHADQPARRRRPGARRRCHGRRAGALRGVRLRRERHTR